VPQRPIIVFDVNETLLNLDAIRPTFERIFSDPAAMRLWFADLILYSEALTLTDNTLAISGRQLEHGGIIDLFERRFSVDETVRRHKRAPEAYQPVAAVRRSSERQLTAGAAPGAEGREHRL
jgi:hypothetical protein